MRRRTTPSSTRPGIQASTATTNGWSDRAWRSTRINIIIIPNMLGNGLSSSPSNTPEPYNASRFPLVTACDNVRLQHRLVTEKFGIKKIPLFTGWSMGALQTFHWGALYPDMVERIAPFCGSAKCSRHNFVFLEGVKAALTADAVFADGWYKEKPAKGLR